MKNQYVGDVNDFRKYGLIRHLTMGASLKCGVVWMLTPDDDRTDGQKIQYLDGRAHLRRLDPDLYSTLHHLVHGASCRSVAMVEDAGIIPGALFVSDLIPDGAFERAQLLRSGLEKLKSCDVLFFDPDNGLEIKSKRRGQKHSNKFLFYDEVDAAFSCGHSLLIYQHFPRESRLTYVARRVNDLRRIAAPSRIYSIATSHVCFFLLASEKHEAVIASQVERLPERWGHEFTVAEH
jgi:hypothetical protein